MGTPIFAVPTLRALDEAFDVVGVITQPDRRAGRGRKRKPSPIKQAALERDLPLFQPRTLCTPDSQAQLVEWRPEVIVVAAFGQLLTQEVLDLPPHGCLNVHASLLPRWRGAAPVATAILSGDQITGVTIMKLDAGLDTGPIVAQAKEPIRPDDTRASLSKRLCEMGADFLVETLPAYLEGEFVPQPQNEEEATYADRLCKEDGRLKWSLSALELDRHIRAFKPWPGTFTTWQGQRFKVLQAEPLPDWQGDAAPGTVIELEDGVAVAAGKGALRLEEVQLAGKRAMGIDAFLCGQCDFVGGRLGEE